MTYKTRFQYLFDKAADIAQGGPASNPQDVKLPPLFFFTDPARTPHPEDIVAHLPQGCGVVYRHFGEHHALQRARLLKRIADDGGLTLLIGEDHELALEVEADGVHLREASLPHAAALRCNHPDLILTAACHDAATLKDPAIAEGQVAALFVSPVFDSRSASAQGAATLGVKGAREMAEGSAVPVYGLGGINCDTISRLHDCGLAGIGAVDAFNIRD
ncbi:MAG: thiamine phosphate synthase [Asticcacaulis sp.]